MESVKYETQRRTSKLFINVNGKDYDLGNLCTIIMSCCRANESKENVKIKCLFTGKTFDKPEEFSKHITKYLIDNERVVLDNDKIK
tara:strand:+ start:444 stop:701 length:258 start_codon:yes stop_codon:yes gene_type:complete